MPYQETKLFYDAAAAKQKKDNRDGDDAVEEEEEKRNTLNFATCPIINGNQFNPSEDGYYIGFVLRVFGKFYSYLLYVFII